MADRAYEAKDMDRWLEAAIEITKKAGAVALEGFHQIKTVEVKASNSDLVTETDKKVEALIKSFLVERFPSHKFIGEEEVAECESGCQLTDEPTWMVDPIDGTSNFVHKAQYSAVSIGLAVKKRSVVGVVYNFILDQLYAAKEGGGATMNGQPIHASQCSALNQAMVIAEFGNNRPENILRPKMDTMYNLLVGPNAVHGIRSMGSAALNMCMVAAGSMDAYFEYGIHCWDIAAGDIIVREAGGVSLLPTCAPMDLMLRGVLCTSTESLSAQLSPYITHIDYQADQRD